MKRMVSLVLAVLLTLSIIPVMPVQAVESADIRSTVTQVYNELKATLNPGESAYDGTFQILSHALFGNGEDLIMDEDDHFSGLVFGSNMFRDAFLDAMTESFVRLLGNYDDEMLVSGSYSFYEHKMAYYISSVTHFMDVPLENEGSITNPSSNLIGRLKSADNWPGQINSFDEALILVAGGCLSNFTIRKTDVSGDSANYHVSFAFRDNFDFGNGNYNGSNAQLAKALTWIGKLMEFGAIVNPFHWEVRLEFDIRFDNDCPHQTENFRWEYNGTDIAAVSEAGFTENTANRIDETNRTTGEQLAPYYELDKPAVLNHSLPWTVEFRMKGTRGFMMSPTASYGVGNPYLLKTHDHVLGGEGFRYTELSEETGEEVTRIGRNQYGVEFTKFGYSKTPWYTFRIENRVNPDGSNMPYLILDGTELGPMNGYYVNKHSVNYDQQQTVDWFNGKDIAINYLFNQDFRFQPDISIDYIQIWENGENNAPHSYYTTSTVAPTCTGKGYTAHVCAQCGDTWKDNFVDPLGHRFGDWEAKDEALHSRTCSVCGEEMVDAHSFADGACTTCGYENHASVEGTWATDMIMPAADLGVSAPDAVLRATLTFGEDGTASCTWEAVDLTAFRIFFHDMFVNSYYALGYGLGITNFEEIEILCRESTGLGVSEYMDTIVTDEAITAAFTPASTSGTYSYNADHSAILTDLPIMDVASDPTVENSFVLGGNTLYLNAASWDKPDYTFVCTAQ